MGGISDDPDLAIRLAAFDALERLTAIHGPVLPWSLIEEGFVYSGKPYRFANTSKGIFRPAGMVGAALSVKSTVPRSGERKYHDIAEDGGSFHYALQRNAPEYHDNKLLLRASTWGCPLIYLFGVEPSFYRPLWPIFVSRYDEPRHSVTLVGADPEYSSRDIGIADDRSRTIIRKYVTVQVKRRLHQEVFAHLVVRAYEERCAVCRLPRRELLDAAHIVPDRDVRGEPSVSNGLALCKLHHAAYDSSLLGITPDSLIEISPLLLDARDGPTLEHGLKAFNNQKLHLPRRKSDRPDPENLAIRYEDFRRTA